MQMGIVFFLRMCQDNCNRDYFQCNHNWGGIGPHKTYENMFIQRDFFNSENNIRDISLCCRPLFRDSIVDLTFRITTCRYLLAIAFRT